MNDCRDSSPSEGRSESAGSAANPLRAGILLAAFFTFFLWALRLPVEAEEVQPQGVVVLSDDGGWCWFQDPRALVHGGKLVVGAVASGRFEPEREGDIEALVHDLQSGRTTRVELFDRLEADDHATPAFLVLPDGRYLTVFSKHSTSDGFHYRISAAHDPTRWGALRNYLPSPSTSLCYSNIFLLAGEQNRIYNFFRGLDDSYRPSFVYSDDLGESWNAGNVFVATATGVRHRPYVRYAGNARDTVHMIYTDGHPRMFDNNIYHVFYRDGGLHHSDGTPLYALDKGLPNTMSGAMVFDGNPDQVGWPADIELDGEGLPYIAFSVQVGSAGLPRGQGGEDHRYFYGRWDGRRWQVNQMAYAGSRLYPGEDDYTGLVALDPQAPGVAYISTNADPTSGEPLISRTDGQRHYEIFRGTSGNGGANWIWTPVTSDSSRDNLRPIVPSWEDGTILLWLRGSYRSYEDYDLEVLCWKRETP